MKLIFLTLAETVVFEIATLTKREGEKNYNLNLKQNNTGNNKKAVGGRCGVILLPRNNNSQSRLKHNHIWRDCDCIRGVNTRHSELQNPAKRTNNAITSHRFRNF